VAASDAAIHSLTQAQDAVNPKPTIVAVKLCVILMQMIMCHRHVNSLHWLRGCPQAIPLFWRHRSISAVGGFQGGVGSSNSTSFGYCPAYVATTRQLIARALDLILGRPPCRAHVCGCCCWAVLHLLRSYMCCVTKLRKSIQNLLI
jgi:hypothetical protein